jgi:uncharacterized protein YjbJ (UPF0337 family)
MSRPQLKRTFDMITKLLSATLALSLLGAMPAATDARADDTFISSQKLTEYLAKDRLLGAKVTGADGKIIGDVEDLIIGSDDQVVGVIMGVGGFLGMGEKKVAVKTSALQLEVTDGKMNVLLPGASKDTLTAAPAFVRTAPKKGLLERAAEKVKEMKDKSSATAKDAYDAAKEKAGPALESAKKQAGEAIEHAKEKAQGVVDKAKDAAQPTAPVEAPKP